MVRSNLVLRGFQLDQLGRARTHLPSRSLPSHLAVLSYQLRPFPLRFPLVRWIPLRQFCLEIRVYRIRLRLAMMVALVHLWVRSLLYDQRVLEIPDFRLRR